MDIYVYIYINNTTFLLPWKRVGRKKRRGRGVGEKDRGTGETPPPQKKELKSAKEGGLIGRRWYIYVCVGAESVRIGWKCFRPFS